jgi:transcriptional regulator with XRE-family HTH domain
MADARQRQLLGEFVRTRREGLPPPAPAGRRRTPGLRREELAARAGISAVWCAWIEQGRDIQASPRALGRLATALDLSAGERATLFALAGRPDPEVEAPAPDTPAASESLDKVVAGFEHPAYALDPEWNAICWNAGAARLFPYWLGVGRQRNLLRYAFLDRSARTPAALWQDWARRLLDEFRADNHHRLDEPAIGALVDELRADSLFFAKSWDAGPASGQDRGVQTFVHDEHGPMAYARHSFSQPGPSDVKLVTLTPATLA